MATVQSNQLQMEQELATPNPIEHLPSEILYLIFSFFTSKELFYKIRPVCRRWRELAMSPLLWKEIDIGRETPSSTLYSWLRKSQYLKIFSCKDRDDLDTVLELISKHCRNLRSIKIHNCWGSKKNGLIRSTGLCNLASRCKKLNDFNFNLTHFSSRKFFKLISRDRGKVRMRKCSYVGPITNKQFKALISSLREKDLKDTSFIGPAHLSSKYKLRQILRYAEEFPEHESYFDNVLENIINGKQFEEEPMQLDI